MKYSNLFRILLPVNFISMNKGTLFFSFLLLTSLHTVAQNLQQVTDSGNITTNTIQVRNGQGLQLGVDSTTNYGIVVHSIKPSTAENRTIRLNCSSSVQTAGWEFYNSSQSRSIMFLQQSGNVGIGTLTPKAKLAVNGDVLARKFKVTQSDWADFVFEPSYSLPPLSEVEAYVKENKHLPEIPSAKQVQEDGLDLGSNQAKLLQKIEELTLYLIEQDKRLKEQEAVIKAQHERIGKLEKGK